MENPPYPETKVRPSTGGRQPSSPKPVTRQLSAPQRPHLAPDRNSFMMDSRSFCGMSPCIDDTVKLASLIFSVSQSTYGSNWHTTVSPDTRPGAAALGEPVP